MLLSTFVLVVICNIILLLVELVLAVANAKALLEISFANLSCPYKFRCVFLSPKPSFLTLGKVVDGVTAAPAVE